MELEQGCTLCRALQGTEASELGGAMQDLARGPGHIQSWEGCPDPQPFILRPFTGPLTICFLP